MIEISLITTIGLAFLMGIVVGLVVGYILDESVGKKDKK